MIEVIEQSNSFVNLVPSPAAEHNPGHHECVALPGGSGDGGSGRHDPRPRRGRAYRTLVHLQR